MKIYISNNPESLREVNPTHTVEAEYGQKVVHGSILTLAHHGPRKHNPCPCLGGNIHCLPDETIIGISHVDLDTIGGIMRILGVKPWEGEEDLFWEVAALVDTKGAHKLDTFKTVLLGTEYYAQIKWENTVNRLYAWWAWSESNRLYPPKDGAVEDVTAQVLKAIKALNIIIKANLSDSQFIKLDLAGEAWIKDKAQLNHDSYIFATDDVIFRSSDQFINHLYTTPYKKVCKAIVGYNTKTKSITVSIADPIQGFSCSEFMQEFFGKEAGGHSGIAGTPRDKKYTKKVAEKIFFELCNKLQ
jgi:hypothetical protein